MEHTGNMLVILLLALKQLSFLAVGCPVQDMGRLSIYLVYAWWQTCRHDHFPDMCKSIPLNLPYLPDILDLLPPGLTFQCSQRSYWPCANPTQIDSYSQGPCRCIRALQCMPMKGSSLHWGNLHKEILLGSNVQYLVGRSVAWMQFLCRFHCRCEENASHLWPNAWEKLLSSYGIFCCIQA